jgi:hypothetical protein
LYTLVQRFDRGQFTYALPLGCYYLVTLGVPLVNSTRAGEAFVAHAAIVLLLPPALILFVGTARWLFSTLIPST